MSFKLSFFSGFILAILVAMSAIVVPAQLFAQGISTVPTTNVPTTASTTGWEAKCTDTENPDVATLQGLECLVANILATATTFIGIAAFGMIILGSFLYLTSGGNPKGTEAGKKAITYAIVGIALSVSAWAILAFFANVFGLEILKEFVIPTL